MPRKPGKHRGGDVRRGIPSQLKKLREEMDIHNQATDGELEEHRLRLEVLEADVRFLRSLSAAKGLHGAD